MASTVTKARPYLINTRARSGKIYHYFRVEPSGRLIRLPGEPGETNFETAYYWHASALIPSKITELRRSQCKLNKDIAAISNPNSTSRKRRLLMPNVAKTKDADTIAIQEIEMSRVRVNLLGKSPLVIHAVSAKNKGALLFPPPKKNAAEKASTMKHEPFEEFREAAYRFTDADKMPTRLFMPAGSIHGAMANAAIDLVGARKAQIGRLTTVEGVKLAVYGIPQIWSTIVRSSDMARTPDVRTLPILPQWVIPGVEIAFVGSLIKQQSIANLLGAAGNIVGIGDGRPEKGKLTMGKFVLVDDNHPDLLRIIKTGGRAAQDAALENPSYYDLETEALLEWFKAERGRRAAAPAQTPRKRRADMQWTDGVDPSPTVGKAMNKAARNIQRAVDAERATRRPANGRRSSART